MSEPTAPAPPPDLATACENESVALTEVEKTLLRYRKKLQKEGQEPVIRACMSSLVIWCDRPELVEQAVVAVPAVVALHPARVLLLAAEPEAADAPLEALVTVRAHPVGKGRRLFSEQITIRAAGHAAVHKLPYVVRTLVVGDLPINVWWATPQPPPLAGVLFHDLCDPAEQVIYDSLGWPDPMRGLAAVASWITQLEQPSTRQRWRLASDLNWRRLKYWRRLLSQALDPAAAPGYLNTIEEVTLEHGPHAVIKAVELVGWLASRLGWRVQAGKVQPGVELTWHFESAHGRIKVRVRRLEQGEASILKLCIRCGPGSLTLRPQGERRLEVIPDGEGIAPRTLTVPPGTVAEMVGRQLSDRERDPIFRGTMEVARILAQSVLG